jgi:hypothetical protein
MMLIQNSKLKMQNKNVKLKISSSIPGLIRKLELIYIDSESSSE